MKQRKQSSTAGADLRRQLDREEELVRRTEARNRSGAAEDDEDLDDDEVAGYRVDFQHVNCRCGTGCGGR